VSRGETQPLRSGDLLWIVDPSTPKFANTLLLFEVLYVVALNVMSAQINCSEYISPSFNSSPIPLGLPVLLDLVRLCYDYNECVFMTYIYIAYIHMFRHIHTYLHTYILTYLHTNILKTYIPPDRRYATSKPKFVQFALTALQHLPLGPVDSPFALPNNRELCIEVRKPVVRVLYNSLHHTFD
jgi:hypothetical protein